MPAHSVASRSKIAALRIAAAALLLSSSFAQAALERWEQLGPPEGHAQNAQVYSINAGSGGAADTIYITTYGAGVEKSTWDGSKWTSFVDDSAGLGNKRGEHFARDGSILYLTTDGGAVWQATIPTDNTQPLAWTQVTTNGLPCYYTHGSIVPAPGRLVVGTQCSGPTSGVFYLDTTAGSPAWIRIGPTAGNSGALAFSTGVHVITFSGVPGAFGCTPNCLYASTSAGLYFTNDYTSSTAGWTPVSPQPTGVDGENVVISAWASYNGGDPTHLYLRTTVQGTGVQRGVVTPSVDYTTVSWTTAVAGPGSLPSGNMPSSAVPAAGSPTGEVTVSVAGRGLWESVNVMSPGNLSFNYIPGTEQLPQIRYAIQLGNDDPTGITGADAMMLLTTQEGVYYGWPNVGQWNRIDYQDVTGKVSQFLVDPRNPFHAFATTGSSVYELNGKGGRDATKVDLPGLSIDGNRIALDTTTGSSQGGDTLYVGSLGSIMSAVCQTGQGCSSTGTRMGPNYPGGANSLPSLDGVVPGVILDPNSAGPGQPLYAFSDRRFPGEISPRGIWKSTDGGNTWSDFNGTGNSAIDNVGGVSNFLAKHIESAAITTDGTIFVGTRGGLFKSSTASPSWSAVSTPLPLDSGTSPPCCASHVNDVVADGNNVYVAYDTADASGGAGPSTGIYSGTSTTCCTKMSLSVPAGARVNRIAVTHPGGSATPTLWVGTYNLNSPSGGIYVSTDGGTTWRTDNIKLSNTNVAAFGVAYANGQPVAVTAAGTIGGGVFEHAIQNGPDFDNDGYADILWRSLGGASAGKNYMWLMKGLQPTSSGYLPTLADTNWVVGGEGDFDGDGATDIVLHNNSTGANWIWLMNGTTIVNQGPLPTLADVNWVMAGVGDFNGDGKSDILLHNNSTGANWVWMMNGLTIASQGGLPTVAGWTPRVGDFNGDGKSDILLHKATGENWVWMMNGLSIASQGGLPTVPDTAWTIAGVGDQNGDYMSDILWRNTSTGENYLWQMSGLTLISTCGALGCQNGYLPSIPDTNWQAHE